MERKNAIQGWRGLAIIMIFLAHTRSFLIQDMSLFSDFGEKGVYIFLVISGVLLYRNSLVKDYAGNLKDGFRYAVNKVKHLYPLHLALWLVLFILTTTKANLIRNIIYSIFNVSLTQSFVPFSGIINAFNGPSWYLSMCMFLWILTPAFIKFVNRCKLKEKDGKLFLTCALIWVLWLNIGNLFLGFVTKLDSRINPNWFERWLLYSCPVLDFVIFAMAYFGYGYFSSKQSKSWLRLFFAAAIIVISVVTKGNVPILWNVPFAAAIIFLVTYTLNEENSFITKMMCWKPMVYMGNISSYFFLTHGVVNLIISRTDLKKMRPFIFVISFAISFGASCLLYHLTERRKMVLVNE